MPVVELALQAGRRSCRSGARGGDAKADDSPVTAPTWPRIT
jgi:hypothetical protein